MTSDIIIVSGLPRSGTSLMMQMLVSGGLPVVTDEIRRADDDNPRGYFEFERVKKIKTDCSWLPDLRGKAVKLISQLLYDLPHGEERYRVIFMERDLNETLTSQEKMLERRGVDAAPREKMKSSYLLHLERLFEWLGLRKDIKVLRVCYNDLVSNPEREATRLNEFLDGGLDVELMTRSVDPALYRNRANA